jgi:hypothetical protein
MGLASVWALAAGAQTKVHNAADITVANMWRRCRIIVNAGVNGMVVVSL